MTSAGDDMIGNWGIEPRVLLFGDTPRGLADISECVRRGGGRLVAALPVEQACSRLEQQVLLDLLVIDISRDHGDILDALFRKAEAGRQSGRFQSIVVVSPEMLDIAVGGLGDSDILIVVGGDGVELDAAVSKMLRRKAPQLNDASDDAPDLELRDLFGAMENNWRRIVEAADGSSLLREDEPARFAGPSASADELKPEAALAIREIIRGRRLREQFFESGMFADPAWDILLDLAAARIEGRSVAVSSLCIAAAVPATTGLRWIKLLTAAGWLQRVADPDDGRRVFIELTDRAAQAMFAYFNALLRMNR